jgi:hypothetical protein
VAPHWIVPLQNPGAILLAVAGLWFINRGFSGIVAGARAAGAPDQSSRVIAGFRTGIIGIGAACLAVGLWLWSWPWALFALVFLGEELVETTIQSLAARSSAGRE